MKYIPKKFKFTTEDELGTYLDRLRYSPGIGYICKACGKVFKTELGGYNHIDYKHND